MCMSNLFHDSANDASYGENENVIHYIYPYILEVVNRVICVFLSASYHPIHNTVVLSAVVHLN